MNALAEASKLIGGAVAGNPFINAAGQQSLAAGQVPQLNTIDPAFLRYTSPTITQMLQGLFQSGGVVRPEDFTFALNQWRPTAYR